MAKVQTFNNKGKIVTSNLPIFPGLSSNSLLTIYSSSHKVHGLLPYIEQVSRSDLELPLLLTIVEHYLASVVTNSRLSIVVVDFLVTRDRPSAWHIAKIGEIMELVRQHPKENFVRFG